MRRPENPGRTRGAQQKLWVLTYSQIAKWAGLEVRTVQEYASRGQFERDNLESVLEWVNARRRRQGLPLIGQPDSDTPENVTPDPEPDKTRVNPPRMPTVSGYNPLTGEYEG
jgi:hypothetical protein